MLIMSIKGRQVRRSTLYFLRCRRLLGGVSTEVNWWMDTEIPRMPQRSVKGSAVMVFRIASTNNPSHCKANGFHFVLAR